MSAVDVCLPGRRSDLSGASISTALISLPGELFLAAARQKAPYFTVINGLPTPMGRGRIRFNKDFGVLYKGEKMA
jgi:hypothetical protein